MSAMYHSMLLGLRPVSEILKKSAFWGFHPEQPVDGHCAMYLRWTRFNRSVHGARITFRTHVIIGPIE